MMSRLLTLVIPTYNRSECLAVLLTTLAGEINGLEEKVDIIIGNNASTDNTSIVIADFVSVVPSAIVLNHSTNLGPDENFCKCIDQIQSKFIWIIGDDDLPKQGVLRRIVKLLERKDIDILYLNSEWRPIITGADDGRPVTSFTDKMHTREGFARQVNVWVTFISGMIVNLQRLRELNPEINLRRFSATSLVQLGWVLPLLMTGDKFFTVKEKCVLATSGNTGGYKLFTVFGTNLRAILATVCGASSVEFKIFMKHLTWSYIPKILWESRFGHVGSFKAENVLESLTSFKSSFAYWLLILPLAKFPKIFALPFIFIAKLFTVQHRIRINISSALKKA
jgi:abequosyltransferase